MKLPFLLSVPHAGLIVPRELTDSCRLTAGEIAAESDTGAGAIYKELRDSAAAVCTAEIARAIIDLNRAPDDFGTDGVVKILTGYGVPVYHEFPSRKLVEKLLARYYHPYHRSLRQISGRPEIKIGLDCHTMAPIGPPAAPDPGRIRPLVCISNGNRTCPDRWLVDLADCFGKIFPRKQVKINEPFRGGYIIRSHSTEIPWLQIEISRTKSISEPDKSTGVMRALSAWSPNIFS